MASYIENALMPNEQVLYETKLSVWQVMPLYFVGAILIIAYGIGLLIIAYAYLKLRSTEIAVTSKRVIVKTGIVSRNTIELNLRKIEGITVNQDVFGRLLNYGSLTISGVGSMKEPLRGIDDPIQFRNAFNEAHEQALGL